MRLVTKIGLGIVGAGLLTGIFFFITTDNVIPLSATVEGIVEAIVKPVDPNADIGPQPQLASPPSEVRALYITGYAGGSSKKVEYFFDLLKTTELNAVVLDIKDYTGMVSYVNDIPLVKQYQAYERKIPRINALIKRFHDAGVYVIGRIAVFQDAALVAARPDLALRSKTTGEVWRDYKKVPWLDTASQEAWAYNVEIARDALTRGFDEINFDYIRFASDGNLKDITYPFFDSATTLKQTKLKEFFAFLRAQLPTAKLSADLFGLVTVNTDDLGIGQYLEDALPYFDYIAPMTYPSHYNPGFIGFPKPAEFPYEVVKYSIDKALARMNAYDLQLSARNASSGLPATQPLLQAKLRPWIQDFNVGATYDATKVRAQIQAVYDAVLPPGAVASPSAYKNGWMLWSPSNVYTKGALLPK